MKSIKLYNVLIEKLNAYEMKLLNRYGELINCKKCCSDCCILESVFPIEAYMIYSSSIAINIIAESFPFNERKNGCVFLKDEICTIYPVRSVICRTHGYPVLLDGRVDICPKNFKDIKSIDSEYILELENVNNAIASINIMFQREIAGETDKEFFLNERISLRELKDFITHKYGRRR